MKFTTKSSSLVFAIGFSLMAASCGKKSIESMPSSAGESRAEGAQVFGAASGSGVQASSQSTSQSASSSNSQKDSFDEDLFLLQLEAAANSGNNLDIASLDTQVNNSSLSPSQKASLKVDMALVLGSNGVAATVSNVSNVSNVSKVTNPALSALKAELKELSDEVILLKGGTCAPGKEGGQVCRLPKRSCAKEDASCVKPVIDPAVQAEIDALLVEISAVRLEIQTLQTEDCLANGGTAVTTEKGNAGCKPAPKSPGSAETPKTPQAPGAPQPAGTAAPKKSEG